MELESGAWKSGRPIQAAEVDEAGAGVVVFWQTLPRADELLRLRTPAVWVPMYDSSARRANSLFWSVVRESGVRVVSFSRALSRTAASHGIQVIDCTYFPEPLPQVVPTSSPGALRVFLWDRGEIGFRHLKALLGAQDVAEILLRIAPDPGLRPSLPTSEELARYHVRVVEGPRTREQHLALVSSCDVFVAPRELEGIGLSYLEAMALGLAVVAPDRPTMNEYITDGVNGYLYDPRRPRRVDLSSAKDVGRTARHDVEAGYRRWLSSGPRSLAEALAPFPERRPVRRQTAAVAMALAMVEKAKACVPPRQKALAARALRSYRP